MERNDTAVTDAPQAADDDRHDDRLDVTDEVLVEEVSIDGMCGVY